ncbi:MAG: helix-turn-helix transcriptional regulator [Bacteroidales bacterium]|nr:helix-turn-helix transcriptional regulator [Bacteroidales bacterium]
MKQLFFTLIIITTFAGSASAQYNDHRDRKLDSLENVVAGWTPARLALAPYETQTDVCLAFSQLMYGYERINPDRSMYAARRAYELGNELKSLYQPYLAAKFIGQLFYNKEQYDSTIIYYRIALGYLDRMSAGEAGPDTPEGYPQEKIDDAASSLYGNIGNLYYEIDSLPQAMAYYAKAGDIFKKYGWKISSSILEHNMGDIWADEGEDAKAIEYYNSAISYAKEAGDSLWVASPKLGLGALYMRRGKVTKALQYLQEADEYYSKHQDQEYYDRIATLDIMGQAYRAQKQQRTLLAAAFAVLALTLLMLLGLSRRALRLKKENAAADEAIGEALTELEMNNSHSGQERSRMVELSRGEQEILPMIAEGLTSKEIANRLFLTEQTIKWRRQRLIAKFDAKNTAEMLSKARECGLL